MTPSTTTPTIAADVVTVIEEREYVLALEDSKIRQLNQEANAFLTKLRREGRDF